MDTAQTKIKLKRAKTKEEIAAVLLSHFRSQPYYKKVSDENPQKITEQISELLLTPLTQFE